MTSREKVARLEAWFRKQGVDIPDDDEATAASEDTTRTMREKLERLSQAQMELVQRQNRLHVQHQETNQEQNSPQETTMNDIQQSVDKAISDEAEAFDTASDAGREIHNNESTQAPSIPPDALPICGCD